MPFYVFVNLMNLHAWRQFKTNPMSFVSARGILSKKIQPPLVERTIGDALRVASEKWGSKDALISLHQQTRWCWEELLYQSESFAKGLVELGLAKGDRVGIYAPNMNEWVVAQFAASLSDLVLVNVNPSYQTHDLQYALNKVQMKALILAPSFKSSNYVDIMQSVCPELKQSNRSATLHSPAVPSLRHVILTGDKKVNGFIPFDDVYFHGHHADYSARTADVDMMSGTNIQFTSGTTGNPKAALLSHHSILNNGLCVGANLAYTPEDRIGISVPLYHCFGMVLGNLSAVNYGCAMVYSDYSFNPVATMDAVESERITSLYGVPTMFLEYVKEQDRRPRNISSLRTGIVAGAICPPALMDQMTRNLNLEKITNMYGMTETSPVTFMLPMDAPLEKKLTTVGTIAPHCEAKIVDSDGETVPRGMMGEIYTRGYTNMLGYWQDDVATKNTINSDGWVVTGDLATMDKDGYVSIVGRIKDMIIRGGENVYPSELEAYFGAMPNVVDCSVFGVPDDKYGEQIAMWITVREGATVTREDIVAFSKGKIAHYKIPHYIKTVQAFPTTVTGKIQKFKMKEMAVAELGLQSVKSS